MHAASPLQLDSYMGLSRAGRESRDGLLMRQREIMSPKWHHASMNVPALPA